LRLALAGLSVGLRLGLGLDYGWVKGMAELKPGVAGVEIGVVV